MAQSISKLTAEDRPLDLRLRAEGADGLRVFIGPSCEDNDLASCSCMHAGYSGRHF